MTRIAPARQLVTWLAPALLLGMLALGACGPATGGTDTGTPDAATILKSVKAATLNDETYTMSLTTTGAGQASTITIQGKATTNPKREQLDVTVNASGTNANYTLIEDGATTTAYAKFNAAGSLGWRVGQWFKVPRDTAEALSSGIDEIRDITALSVAKLVGAEQINGVTVWHLTGWEILAATSISSSENASDDLYVRQDNYYPVKMVVKTTGADATTGTITWSAVNSGINIALPKPSEVSTLPVA